MANRIINAAVSGETIKLSNKIAGAAGSCNAVSLALSFDGMWDGTTKKVYFFDVNGGNAVVKVLTADLLTDGAYLVPIPAEPLQYAGEITLTVKGVNLAPDGVTAERVVMSATTTMKVLNAEVPSSDTAPVEPNATQTEQLQAEIDTLTSSIESIPTNVAAAATSAANAASSATAADASKTAAESAETTAVTKAAEATQSASGAATSATAAQTAQAAAESAETAAAASESAAAQSKADAAASATTATQNAAAAAASEANALTYQSGAQAASTAASTAKTDAISAKDAAVIAQSAAETAKTGAETAKDGADAAKADAVIAKTAAETAAAGAESAKSAAVLAKTAAETAQTAAETAAAGASTSETNAGNSAAAAAGSASSAASSASTATTKATEAANSATSAAGSASTATTKAAAASTSATDAAQSAAEAAQSAQQAAAGQVNSDWNVTDPTSKAFIKNKPTNVSEFANDAGYLTQHQDISEKLDKTGDGSNVTAAFTAASARANIATGEKLSVLLGKIAKWFADLGALAFKSTAAKTDLASDVQASLGKADTALQSFTETDPTVPAWAKAATKPSYTKSEVGLGNVDNTADSAKPVSTAQQTALNGKANTSHTHTKSQITDFPTSMTPTAHKSTHATGGTDALTPANIGAAAKYSGTATLTVAGWTGTAAPFTQAVTCAGILATDTPTVDCVTGTDATAGAAIVEAWGLAVGGGINPQTGAGTITFYASEKPAVAVPFRWEGTR